MTQTTTASTITSPSTPAALPATQLQAAPPTSSDRPADPAFASLMTITDRPDVVFTHGAGSWLWDQHERRYLDFVQGWAVNSLGHCPDVLREALAAQAARLINPSPAYFNAPAGHLARRLTELSTFDRVFFASSGAEANEGAIKLARRWGAEHRGGAHRIITFENAFHGRTLATMSASGKPSFEALFEPKVPGFSKARLNDLDSVLALIGDDTVAVLIEPVQGEAGVVPAEPAFLRALRELTAQRRLLLIVDEIQTGVGRCGTLWAHEQAGIAPDIMTLGKGIGGGVPLSALLATEHVACFRAGDQGGTYCGNPLMAAAGLAVIETVSKPAFLQSVRDRAGHLRAGLERLAGRAGLGAVRGLGLLQAIGLPRPVAHALVEQARHRGLLINAPRADCIRFMPALNVGFSEIDEMLERLEAAWRSCS